MPVCTMYLYYHLDNAVRPVSPSPNSAWKSTKRMILVKNSAQRGHSVGHWPLPESYWPDAKSKTLVSVLERMECTVLLSWSCPTFLLGIDFVKPSV